MPGRSNRGINHLALVCKEVERTVRFYREALAFIWFPEAAEAAPG
jgi:hypothetical protein